MHRFVRGGKKLLERKIGIFGGMDVRMGSMLFFSFVLADAFPSTHYNAFFKFFLQCFLLLLENASLTHMRIWGGKGQTR